jgi:hypothetical protein
VADTHLRPWCVAARGKWGGRVTGAPGSCRSTVRWNERNGMITHRGRETSAWRGAQGGCVVSGPAQLQQYSAWLLRRLTLTAAKRPCGGTLADAMRCQQL